MSNVVENPVPAASPPGAQHVLLNQRPVVQLGVSSYDRVAGTMVALIILIGTSVLLLFLLWLTSRVFSRPTAVPVVLLEEIEGRGDHAVGTARDLEPPGIEEMADLEEPQLTDTLEAITDAISTQLASIDSFDGVSPLTGTGGGLGDSRRAGPLGEGDDVIPRFERWEIHFESTSTRIYAQQLDFFGIELGAAGGGDDIQYAFHLTNVKPDRKTGPGDKEKRLYMSWRAGKLQGTDKSLLSKAGIPTKNRIILQFYPAATEEKLAQAEAVFAGGRSVKEIRRTVFAVKSVGDGFSFVVMDQEYR